MIDPSKEIVLRINPLCSRITVEQQNGGVISKKNISSDALLDCIQKSHRIDAGLGILPANCVGINFQDQKQFDILIEHPQRRTDFIYYDKTYYDLPLPRLLFKYCISSGMVASCSLAVIQDVPAVTLDTPLFSYPFSNVNADFRICMGVSPLPKYTTLSSLSGLSYYILGVPNNHDSFRRENNRLKLHYWELLEYLLDKEPDEYYKTILIPSGKTVRDFFGSHTFMTLQD